MILTAYGVHNGCIKSLIILEAIALAILVVMPSQTYAYTLIEFAVVDPPTTYSNVTYTIEDRRLDEEYEWLQFGVDYCCVAAEHAKLPDGVAIAGWDDPIVQAYDAEPLRAIDSDYDGGLFTVINQTIEPGTPIEMCISYDKNKNLTRCELTAVADHSLGSYLILQVDIDAPKEKIVRTDSAQ
jgi:hypothetical protein